MYSVNTIEIINPKQITVPTGPQSGDQLGITEITPAEAAVEVRKMGRILRFPAANAASRIGIFLFSFKSLA